MSSALVCIDFIHDIVGEGGKLSGKGYRAFADKHNTLATVRSLQESCRDAGIPVIHVRVGFDPSYLNHPTGSPLFGAAAQFGALTQHGPGTEFVPSATPQDDELVLWKPRVSAFYGTALESALRALGAHEVLFAGVATDLAVQAAARDAHDRDFAVKIVQDACAAASDEDHDTSLPILAKIATIIESADAA